jgi:dephospho-CoA kinase
LNLYGDFREWETMIWVAITGPMGSGKSSVAGELRARGYAVLDADQVVHDLLRPGSAVLQKIFATFGESLRQPDGTLDRRTLGQTVFADSEKLAQLEAILHPEVRAEVARRRAELAAQGHKAAFYDVPLLFEKKMESQFDSIIVVTASPQNRMDRLRARTGLSIAEIEDRWKSQLPPEYKESRASILIRNDGDGNALKREVERALLALGLSPTVT